MNMINSIGEYCTPIYIYFFIWICVLINATYANIEWSDFLMNIHEEPLIPFIKTKQVVYLSNTVCVPRI